MGGAEPDLQSPCPSPVSYQGGIKSEGIGLSGIGSSSTFIISTKFILERVLIRK